MCVCIHVCCYVHFSEEKVHVFSRVLKRIHNSSVALLNGVPEYKNVVP